MQHHQNADDSAPAAAAAAAEGVNRAECRPPLPSSIAPSVVITAPLYTDIRHVTKSQNPRNEGDDVSKLLSAEVGQLVTQMLF